MINIPDTTNNVFVSPSSFLIRHARNKVIARHGEMVSPSKDIQQDCDHGTIKNNYSKKNNKI
ncbi:MAG: hypothetical protein OEL89_04050 [Candidatus Peregrinibacteria bacterium]|nr:hypothetical protein [Candidatus Peregrinibacteria bacterium]